MSKYLSSMALIFFLLFSLFALAAQAQETCTGDICTINTAQQKTTSSPWESDAEKHMKEWEALSKQGAKSGNQYQYDLIPKAQSEKKVSKKEVKKKEVKEPAKKTEKKAKVEAKANTQTYQFHSGKNVLHVTLKDGKIVNKGYAIWDSKDPSANKIKDLMIPGISFEKIEKTLGPGRLMTKGK